MIRSRIGWTCWALVPVLGLAWHYGPGQVADRADRAARLVVLASQAQADAESAQQAAYAAHLEAKAARASARTTGAAADKDRAATTAALEKAAYAVAATAWQSAADAFGAAHDLLADPRSPDARRLRWARSRAQIRAGHIASGTTELEGLLSELAADGLASSPLARQAREELGAGFYYGARLLRMAGQPTEVWRAAASKARQQFRWLAESARALGDEAQTARADQHNVELVLDLEQSGPDELEAEPLPRDSPQSDCAGLCGT